MPVKAPGRYSTVSGAHYHAPQVAPGRYSTVSTFAILQREKTASPPCPGPLQHPRRALGLCIPSKRTLFGSSEVSFLEAEPNRRMMRAAMLIIAALATWTEQELLDGGDGAWGERRGPMEDGAKRTGCSFCSGPKPARPGGTMLTARMLGSRRARAASWLTRARRDAVHAWLRN